MKHNLKKIEQLTVGEFAEFLKLVEREVKAREVGLQDREAIEAINSHPCSSSYFGMMFPECQREVKRRLALVR